MDTTVLLNASLFITGFVLGLLLLWLFMRGRIIELEAARKLAEINLASAQAGPGKAGETFQALAAEALRSNQQAFLESARSTLETVRVEMTGDLTQRQTAVETVVKPLAESLTKLETQIHELESARQRAFGGLEQQLQTMAQRELDLQKETASLVTALRAPQVRGRWGEITLKRVAELAGMVERCDFVEQATQETENGRIRPDMTVRLPGDRTIVVDAKVPLTAYLDSVAATSDAERRNSLMRHSQQVAKHVEQLSNKAYWAQFQPAPEFVILFLPGDHFFSAALEFKPSLVEDAARVKILVATPSTLIAILKGVAYGWRQERMAANAEQIRQLAAELFDRFVTLQSHFGEIGRSLGKSVESFNRCVGSLETRVYPSLRRIRELGATAAEEPPPPEAIEAVPRTPDLFEES
ncbi:MAG TPA: DNA recombination protein RmuC [Bryobacteraceae bacterium]|jgi:DNA recombination protein RmuC|nr:DNA recombination protein RmuC [Bryobacteraceae bacterium]